MANDKEKDNGHGQEKEIEIIVNGKKKVVTSKELAFDQVVDLAYEPNPRPTGDNWVFTVTYRKAEGKPEGTLLPGDTVKVKDGTIFNVTATDKS
jgi:hypothetical protein